MIDNYIKVSVRGPLAEISRMDSVGICARKPIPDDIVCRIRNAKNRLVEGGNKHAGEVDGDKVSSWVFPFDPHGANDRSAAHIEARAKFDGLGRLGLNACISIFIVDDALEIDVIDISDWSVRPRKAA